MISAFDVVIVGAGPAGTAAAYDLRLAGLSVALLDKAEFPRMKPCAGGLTVKTVQAFRYSIAPVVQKVCSSLHLSLKTRQQIFRAKGPVVYMTVRSELDAFNLEKAQECGAEFIRIGALHKIHWNDGLWSIEAGDQHFQATYLIGADGANSRVRQLCFPEQRLDFGCAAEAMIPYDTSQFPQMEMDFSYGPGYAWVFPKSDHLNVGVYSLSARPGIKAELTAYCQKRLGHQVEPGAMVGHRVPFHQGTVPFSPSRPLLVGDAAGLADPFFGEGIYNAVRSGQLAAQTILDQRSDKQDLDLDYLSEVREDLKSYARLTQWFYRHPSLGFSALSLLPCRYVLMKGVAMGWTTRKTLRQFLQLPFTRLAPQPYPAAPLDTGVSKP